MPAIFARPRAAIAAFARARRGSTAVEFAFVSIPFLILLFGILELGAVFMVSTSLEDATDRAARQIRTGEFQSSGAATKADFITLVCSRMAALSTSCTANLSVDVRTFTTFTTASQTAQITGGNFDKNTTCWSTGQPTDIVLVRTFYEWKLFTPMLDAALQNMGNGKRLIGAVATFRNEPYNNNAPAGAATCPS
jgi:Flp pilus assembly protein TadG